MDPAPIDYRDHDRRFWEEELEEFVPRRLYDAHIHLFTRKALILEARAPATVGEADFSTLQSWATTLYPGRETHFLVLGMPYVGTDVEAHNRMMAQQVSADPLSRMNRLTVPSNSPEEIKRDIEQFGFIGLKPYRIYSVTGDVDQCRIRDFLPEPQLELANELGLWVTMHLSRHQGGGDELNLQDLEEYTTKRYPRIKWILAHNARSFTYYQIKHGIDRLREMPNIWYDLSAVCELHPFITLFAKEDHKRLLWGSDGIDSSFFHGKYMALGRTWGSFNADDRGISWGYPRDDGPILAIYEQIHSMKVAAELAGFSRDDVEDVFWRNAVRELGVDWPE